MNSFRSRAPTPTSIPGLDTQQHEHLQRRGAEDANLWTGRPDSDAHLINTFRREVKFHFYHHQKRRCCYCSKELDRHGGSFDAEHILDRSRHPWLMFHLSNIAVCCKTCGGKKSNKRVLAAPVTCPSEPPDRSTDYLIVHPQIDEWDHFLEYDKFNRVQAKDGHPKGRNTISVCGIHLLNSARLADFFSPDQHASAEKAIEKFFSLRSTSHRQKWLRLLDGLAQNCGLESARVVVALLAKEDAP